MCTRFISVFYITNYFGNINYLKNNTFCQTSRFLTSQSTKNSEQNDNSKSKTDKLHRTRQKNTDKTTKKTKKVTEKEHKIFDNVQNVKISDENGFNSLYNECMNEIYKSRFDISNMEGSSGGNSGSEKRGNEKNEFAESEAISEMTRAEQDIIRNVFKRVYCTNKFGEKGENYPGGMETDPIDPYWNPFNQIHNLKQQINFEFNQLSKLISNVELYKYKLMIRKALKQFSSDKEFDPTTFDSGDKSTSDYKYKHEMYWDPSIEKRMILQNNSRPFTFRDGQFLPRRLNLTTRRQQRQIFKAVKISRQMGLLPYNSNGKPENRIPLISPVQYLYDELFFKYKKDNDLRAKTLINVLMNKFPNNNYFKYLKYEAEKNK